ncbi:MAG TPA: LssY C-terminal domain-containing protein [Planctomycetota bacterium]
MALASLLRRLLTTPYEPDPAFDDFTAHAPSQEGPLARVALAVLDAQQSRKRFGVELAQRGVQPVWVRVENRSQEPMRLHVVGLDPHYYTALEAAGLCRFSFTKRLTAFGAVGWVFLPLLALVPLKVVTAVRANRRMDRHFRREAFHLRPIAPGGSAEGFVFTTADLGTKELHVQLVGTGTEERAGESVEFVFTAEVPGFEADHHTKDLDALAASQQPVVCDRIQFVQSVVGMPVATTNRRGTGQGDPVNLVVVGTYQGILSAFGGRWDETETISLASCWKTTRAFLLGSQYRYSPVSPLYLFGRSQDIALQRIRRSIHERLHLRLWMSPLRFRGFPVWVGQVSRDIGVRFTTKAWSLTTHRIDPDVDESRDYVVQDLLEAGRIDAAAYLGGVGKCTHDAPRHNLTGDPYFTDGRRAAILLSPRRTTPRFVLWD